MGKKYDVYGGYEVGFKHLGTIEERETDHAMSNIAEQIAQRNVEELGSSRRRDILRRRISQEMHEEDKEKLYTLVCEEEVLDDIWRKLMRIDENINVFLVGLPVLLLIIPLGLVLILVFGCIIGKTSGSVLISAIAKLFSNPIVLGAAFALIMNSFVRKIMHKRAEKTLQGKDFDVARKSNKKEIDELLKKYDIDPEDSCYLSSIMRDMSKSK